MRKRNAKKAHPVLGLVFVLFGLVAFFALLLQGADVALFSPKGTIAAEQTKYIVIIFGVLVAIAVPTLFLLFFTAWKYRETNEKAVYSPDASHSKSFSLTLWAIPTIVMLILVSMMWPATHRLAPQRDIDSSVKPIDIKVVALRWKWLFIYPEQKIASVNYLQIPVDTPIRFDITADEAPMSSFWIPHLGGQLYAMTGHVNRLNLMADTIGEYRGASAEINGEGFAGMKFRVNVTSGSDFDRWVESSIGVGETLDQKRYEQLIQPSEYNKVTLFGGMDPDLYGRVISKYAGMHGHSEGWE